MQNLIGIQIDNYRIVSVLGKGGMGIVYKAYDTKLDRFVAIKMLNSDMYDRLKFIERFKREAKNQAKLSHPNIVTVYGFIEYDNLLGIVMEYVEGESLDKILRRQGRFNLYDVFYILKQILLGLGYAHSKGFVHRDIKPSNIVLNKEGVAKVMDFGISKSLFDDSAVTKTGAKIGTVYYMSPEQIKGYDVTNRSDIYSLGCTAYEMIVGHPPFDYESEYEIMDSHLKKSPPKISSAIAGIPEIVDELILRAMAKNPNDRYATCEEMYEEVQRVDQQVAKLYTNYFRKTEARSATYKFMSASAFALFFIVLIGISYFVYTQVDELLKSNALEELKKYNIEALFSSPEDEFSFKEIVRIQSPVDVNLNGISFSGNTFAVAVGDSGVILTSNNNGQNWKLIGYDKKVNLSDVYCSPLGKTIIVGDSSTILYSANFLDSIRTVQVRGGYTFFRVKFIDEQTGFITGSDGLIMKTVNGGISWYKVVTNTKDLIFDLDFSNDRHGIAVGWNGLMLTTENGGESWHPIENVKFDNYIKSIDITKEGYCLAAGGDATILRSINYGKDWEIEKVAELGGLQKVLFISENYAVVTGSKGILMFSKDKGNTWNLIESRIYSNMNDLELSPERELFMVGVNGMIFKIF
ncbi:serine/threonine protein kinase with PASTA sensor(s) [Melioribacter roseus P3M-2]|uniref:non-specific serine/threonine protein kinase n=1 Tax=Melioribacter roseus (strain DSM 23840 / JCM 17771 / VKM B-2668 / P3M-2) TaxID=1191523 RepID=I7A6K4_MELRP|nr:protein kinase [Melioribacter roseus]AFN75506.1 serine/threonine protein kinase with PASTA sensor(s) [Melioribacter roseus P3M-2]